MAKTGADSELDYEGYVCLGYMKPLAQTVNVNCSV